MEGQSEQREAGLSVTCALAQVKRWASELRKKWRRK